MSDLTDDNPLFSQDDIDKLLNASSIEEAEDVSFNNEEDEIGELSQDDIDRLLNAASAPEEPELPPSGNLDEEEEELDLGEISQDDIDRLLSAASTPVEREGTSSLSSDQETGGDTEDLGELSQDDIDRMLTESASDEADTDSVQSDFEDDGGGAFDLISQDDIDKLMSTDLSDDQLPPGGMAEEIALDGPDFNVASSDEEVIDPSEAWNIQDCLITQESIDNLLNSNDQDDPFKQQPESNDPFQVNLSADDFEPEFTLDGSDDIAGSDLDNLLSESPDDLDDLLNDISQDDIDGFLNDSDSQTGAMISGGTDDGESVRNIISQDDIDALLSGTDEEDEDILADMEMDEDLKSSASPVRSVESSLPEDDDGAQVILEEPEEATTLADGTVRELTALTDEEHEKPYKRRFIFRLTIVLVLIITLIVGCVAGAYFLFFKDKVAQFLPFSEPVVNTQDNKEMNTAVPEINIQESQELTPGTMTMENFMVLTPDRKDGITYISVDISINYSYSKVFDAINSKLPYYRGVIYDSIEKALKSDRGDKLTESDLLEIVKNAFSQTLPDMKVDKIVFVNFKTG